ncbi:hypothetical protein CC80DRAFT_493013 [Byssothecium circinans]|uniref:Uncharacterized protein n=1 Tax=Byssothecium circinans TaxID=147558 RepID=A0A6A5TXU9_9PLEO|nr:hypothetical protein CC80DRAFT_493013 [Byssothecium circinans]
MYCVYCTCSVREIEKGKGGFSGLEVVVVPGTVILTIIDMTLWMRRQHEIDMWKMKDIVH